MNKNISHSNSQVPVLFARRDSVYKKLGCDVWDIDRDARNWPGGHAGIFHPPCRAWATLAQFAKPRPDEKLLAIWSIDQIRKWGGVLEHPVNSRLWPDWLPLPGTIDEYGGFSICVNQSWWGHKAEKKTLLYICGTTEQNMPEIPLSFDRIDYCVRYSKYQWKLRKERGIKSVQEITKREREQTPVEFAKWLIEVAKTCKI